MPDIIFMKELVLYVVIATVFLIIGIMLGKRYCYNRLKKNIIMYIDLSERLQRNLNIIYKWLLLANNGKKLSDFFMSNGIGSSAIYGYGRIGKLLREELESSGIKISYIIDQRAKSIKVDIPVFQLSDTMPAAEAVIVTTNNIFEIRTKIKIEGGIPADRIISLEDIIDLLSH